MKKDDYKTEFEKQRQEIDLDENNDNLPSRAALHGKGRKEKKKSGNLLINIILGLFTLIPVIILVYVVTDFYNPGANPSAKDTDTGIRYEETPKNTTDGKNDDPDKDIALGEKADGGKVDSKDVKEEEPKIEIDKKPEVNTKPEVEKKPEEKPVTKPVVDVNPTPEKKPEVTPEKKPTGKTHKVATGETLYRISVNYYGSDVGVEKIKKANGLSSNNIAVGQTLIIP
ncbi:LysM peptidoglycan-binding domain-containing protein [Sporosarcina sp. NPDC096371]|uniref:LysM peptidoglycan-binding domain-containing protein n=1 Tax=Sporosarcina sp. NPDC096371 TaxID=3364530 RepID=UPI003819C857